MKKIGKKGNVMSLQNKTSALIMGVILIVVLATVAAALWTPLSTALTSLASSTIPFASLFNATNGVIGYVFGAALILGFIGVMFGLNIGKRR